MKRTLVRYRAKPEQAAENARLIEAVFKELHEKAPGDLRYLVLRLADGTFVPFVEAEGDASPLSQLSAFQAFRAGAESRHAEAVRTSEATIVGSYRMLAE